MDLSLDFSENIDISKLTKLFDFPKYLPSESLLDLEDKLKSKLSQYKTESRKNDYFSFIKFLSGIDLQLANSTFNKFNKKFIDALDFPNSTQQSKSDQTNENYFNIMSHLICFDYLSKKLNEFSRKIIEKTATKIKDKQLIEFITNNIQKSITQINNKSIPDDEIIDIADSSTFSIIDDTWLYNSNKIRKEIDKSKNYKPIGNMWSPVLQNNHKSFLEVLENKSNICDTPDIKPVMIDDKYSFAYTGARNKNRANSNLIIAKKAEIPLQKPSCFSQQGLSKVGLPLEVIIIFIKLSKHKKFF